MARDRETDPGFSRQEALGWLGKQLEDEAAKMEVLAAEAGGEDPMVARGVASGVAGREVPDAVAWAGLGRRLWAQIVDVALLGTVAGIQVAVFGTGEVVLIGIITGVVTTFYYVGLAGADSREDGAGHRGGDTRGGSHRARQSADQVYISRRFHRAGLTPGT